MVAFQNDVDIVDEGHCFTLTNDQMTALYEDVGGSQSKVPDIGQLQGSIDEELVHNGEAVIRNDV